MIKNELEIISVEKLLRKALTIPVYQRPYKWSAEAAVTLFNDIYKAYLYDLNEYRIGSVVLHYIEPSNTNDKEKFDIVDGQQRITTLSILIFCISKCLEDNSDIKNLIDNMTLLSSSTSSSNTGNNRKLYTSLSKDAVSKNYKLLKIKCMEIKDELKYFKDYLLKKCTFVKIVTSSQQEAFQFFDCQNTRGKPLNPQDLLKSYHLREMNNESPDEKHNLIEQWEETNQEDLALFFSNSLYPLVRWYRGKSGLNYSYSKIKVFKGIKQSCKYNHGIYDKASSLYIENLNDKRNYELYGEGKINQFQLTQNIIAGKRFFSYILHYYKMYQEVKKQIKTELDKHGISTQGSGNSYVTNMLINAIMFFKDRFNNSALTAPRLNKLIKWAFSLRAVMHAVYIESINNYALGKLDRINYHLNMFEKIYEMQSPEELDLIVLDKITAIDKYKDLEKKL